MLRTVWARFERERIDAHTPFSLAGELTEKVGMVVMDLFALWSVFFFFTVFTHLAVVVLFKTAVLLHRCVVAKTKQQFLGIAFLLLCRV